MSTEVSCMHPNILNSFNHKYKGQSDWDCLSVTQKSKSCQVLQEQGKEQAMKKFYLWRTSLVVIYFWMLGQVYSIITELPCYWFQVTRGLHFVSTVSQFGQITYISSVLGCATHVRNLHLCLHYVPVTCCLFRPNEYLASLVENSQMSLLKAV